MNIRITFFRTIISIFIQVIFPKAYCVNQIGQGFDLAFVLLLCFTFFRFNCKKTKDCRTIRRQRRTREIF